MNTDSGSNQPHLPRHCLNCGHELTSTAQYCPVCGQRTTTGLIPWKSLVGEYFETIFNIDSRFFLTLKWLFVPGYLTKEFFRGKHVSYFRPLRLFFLTLVILYAILGITSALNLDVDLEDDGSSLNYYAGKQAVENINKLKSTMGYDTLPAPQRAFIDSLSASLDIGAQSADLDITQATRDDSTVSLSLADVYELELDSIYKKYDITSFRGRFLTQQLIRTRKEPGKVIQSFIANTSWMVLLLMPFLALILKLLYIRRQRYYVEHLVFLFHYHAAVFVVLSVYILLMNKMPSWLQTSIPFLCFAFLLFAMKAYYGQGWVKTLSKYFTLLCFYLFLLLVFTGLTAMLSLLFY